jgi:hypothetical protein
MLEPHRAVLSARRIVLASASPRRKEILSNARLPNDLEIVPAMCEENLDRAAYGNRDAICQEMYTLLALCINFEKGRTGHGIFDFSYYGLFCAFSLQ